MDDQLVWDGKNCYTCPYGDGQTLYVDEQAWAEARHERSLELLEEQYPNLSKSEREDLLASGSKEADEAIDKAGEELSDASIWALHAIECTDDDGNLVPLNKEEGRIHDFSAWIV